MICSTGWPMAAAASGRPKCWAYLWLIQTMRASRSTITVPLLVCSMISNSERIARWRMSA